MTIRIELINYLKDELEMGEQDILVVARSQGVQKFHLQELTDLELFHVLKESGNLYNEGLLFSYVSHLVMHEEAYS